MYIDGQWINAKNNATFPVFNPANGEKIGDVPNGDREDAAGAIDAAQRVFEKWSTLTAYRRSGYLYDAYRIMTDKREHLARVMTEEQGKPLKAVVRALLNIWKRNWAASLCKKEGGACRLTQRAPPIIIASRSLLRNMQEAFKGTTLNHWTLVSFNMLNCSIPTFISAEGTTVENQGCPTSIIQSEFYRAKV